jgi:hypothetical protein
MNRSEMMVTRAARNIQKRIPQIWKEMELDLPDEYWGVMGDFGDMLKAQRDRVYDFESRVFDEMWEETEKFDKSEQQKLYKLTDLMLKKFLKSPAAKHPTTRLNQRPAGTLRYFPSLDNKKNPASRKNPRHANDDPSREEMIEHIRKVYGREADEFDIEEAIYWFANDYHGGQSSNLYSALSTSEYRPGRSSSGPEEGSMGEMIYADLVDTFSTKKNPLKRRKGESVRDFTSRCMSEEKMSFPKTKQRIAVCLSKSRKRNPVYDTGSDE